jgi:hypothetical protein
VQSYVLPIADRDALAWILREQRTGFGEHRSREAEALEVGDVLLLYTTRGCFQNPTRDRGRVIGRALVASRPRRVRRAPSFGGREYPLVVNMRIETLAPLRTGVELAPLVGRLQATFPDARSWSVRMRRALVPVDTRDTDTIERELEPVAKAYPSALSSYDSLG